MGLLRLKFGYMPYGTKFNDGRRKFIKIQDYLPSGLQQRIFREPFGKFFDKEEGGKLLEFNAIDIETGCGACCPNWVEFNVEKLGSCYPDVEWRMNNPPKDIDHNFPREYYEYTVNSVKVEIK